MAKYEASQSIHTMRGYLRELSECPDLFSLDVHLKSGFWIRKITFVQCVRLDDCYGIKLTTTTKDKFIIREEDIDAINYEEK